MPPQDNFDPNAYMQFHVNNFLAKPGVQDMINRVFKDKHPEIHKQLQGQIELHNKIMDNHFNDNTIPDPVQTTGIRG